MNYLLDTNIIVIYSRNGDLARQLEERLQLFSGEHQLAISVVTLGELNALEKKLKYGENRKRRIKQFLNSITTLDINFKSLIKKYGDIEAFSQDKLEHYPLGTTARNMGKNDLWIAATAAQFDLILLTTDKDFDHLKDRYIKLQYIDLKEYH